MSELCRHCETEIECRDIGDWCCDGSHAAILEGQVAELLDALRLLYDHARLYRPEIESNNVGEAVRKALAKAEGKDHIRDATKMIEPLRNSCDGCCAGHPTMGNLHIGDDGKGYMVCQKDRYDSEPELIAGTREALDKLTIKRK